MDAEALLSYPVLPTVTPVSVRRTHLNITCTGIGEALVTRT